MTRAELEQLADLVAERLLVRLSSDASSRARADASARTSGLIDAHEAGRMLGRSAAWVRRHADALGAVRLGDGPRPRLGFDLLHLAEHVAARSVSNASQVHEAPAQADSAAITTRAAPAPCLRAVPDLTDELAYDGEGVPAWR